jgi:predicted methyltransferase
MEIDKGYEHVENTKYTINGNRIHLESYKLGYYTEVFSDFMANQSVFLVYIINSDKSDEFKNKALRQQERINQKITNELVETEQWEEFKSQVHGHSSLIIDLWENINS